MQIYREGNYIKYSDRVKHYKEALNEDTVIIESLDHVEHIALYIAWQEVGGRIFVRAPALPVKQKKELDFILAERTETNCVFLHTSGTTGSPKLVSFDKENFKRDSN